MRQVVILIPKGDIDISSITGTYHVLSWAELHWRRMGHTPAIDIRLAGYESEVMLDFGFFSIHPTKIEKIERADLLIIPSLNQNYVPIIKNNRRMIDWIANQYKNGSELASICTGSFLLAATGLLNGKQCSTHWDAAHDLQQMFPDLQVRTDVLTTAVSRIYTNAGGYSFLNLAIFLVEKYFDRKTAILCSKMFQIDLDRISQSPFAIFKAQKNHRDDLIQLAQNYIEENFSEKVSFEALASKLAISRRNFDRRFAKATGNSPVEYLQRVRVEAAKRVLEEGDKPIFDVMHAVGYSDKKAFREVFKRITGRSPAEYRAGYRLPGARPPQQQPPNAHLK
jgi:transcriptional regulator GlxA family with amidase domain